MAWILNRNRGREHRRRHSPGMEKLDERCLLAAGVSTTILHNALNHPNVAAQHSRVMTQSTTHHRSVARHPSAGKAHTVGTVGANARVARPAGTIITGAETSYDGLIGAAAARSSYNVDGTGSTVAVIDTGVDYKNAALGGSFGPGSKVVAGYNFATNSPDPIPTASQHGTAVAGLIASSDPAHLGVAPGADIVALRVVGDNNTADLNNVARALQWVIDNHSKYHITVVNMSLSDGGNYAQNWMAEDGGTGQRVTELIGKLKGMNIPVVAATGNNFQGEQGEGFTSIVSGVVSVTATDQSNHLLSNAQRLGDANSGGNGTEVAALGTGIVAPWGDSQFATVQGTSFAAPLVSGAVVLLQQIYQARFGALPTVDQVTNWLEKGSDPVYDSVTGLTFNGLDIPKAASLIPAKSTPSTPRTTPSTSATVVNPIPSPISIPSPAPVTVTPTPAPVAVTPSTPTPTPVSTVTEKSPSVTVYVNGKALGSTASNSSVLPALSQTHFNQLVKAMSAWASADGLAWNASVSNVRIWAASSTSGNVVTPVGTLKVTTHP